MFLCTALMAICAATVSPLALTLVLQGKNPIKYRGVLFELPNGRHISRSALFTQSLSPQRSRERVSAVKRSNSSKPASSAVAGALNMFVSYVPHPSVRFDEL